MLILLMTSQLLETSHLKQNPVFLFSLQPAQHNGFHVSEERHTRGHVSMCTYSSPCLIDVKSLSFKDNFPPNQTETHRNTEKQNTLSKLPLCAFFGYAPKNKTPSTYVTYATNAAKSPYTSVEWLANAKIVAPSTATFRPA